MIEESLRQTPLKNTSIQGWLEEGELRKVAEREELERREDLVSCKLRE